MFYGDKEKQDSAARETANAYRQAAALFPIIRRTAQEFDGKVYNCRFEKALRDNDGGKIRFYCRKRYKFLEVSTYISTPLGNQEFTLVQIALDDLVDGKRIPADLITESARKTREELLQRAAQIEREAEQAHLLKTQLEYLKGKIDTIVSSLDYATRDIFDLHYRVYIR